MLINNPKQSNSLQLDNHLVTDKKPLTIESQAEANEAARSRAREIATEVGCTGAADFLTNILSDILAKRDEANLKLFKKIFRDFVFCDDQRECRDGLLEAYGHLCEINFNSINK